jgi:hypothetical protein
VFAEKGVTRDEVVDARPRPGKPELVEDSVRLALANAKYPARARHSKASPIAPTRPEQKPRAESPLTLVRRRYGSVTSPLKNCMLAHSFG